MPLDQYVIGSVIGKGSYGEVTLATYKKDKKKVIFVFKHSHNRHLKQAFSSSLRFCNRKLTHLKELAFQNFTLKKPRMLKVDQEANT